MKYLMSLLLLSISTLAIAQLDDELGFLYVKAEYMLEKGYYQEANEAFTKIILRDASFKEALVKRADARLNLGEYKEAKSDIMDFFDVNGVTEYSVKIFSLVQAKVGNAVAAGNTADLALLFDGNDPTVLMAKAESLKDQEQFEQACIYWKKSARMGNNKAMLQHRKYCGGTMSQQDEVIVPNTPAKPRSSTKFPNRRRVDEVGSEGSSGSSDDVVVTEREAMEEAMPEEPKIDMTINEVEVDEDLSLIFKNGIGSREILKQPNILILSESSGTVAVDVCVNSRGKIETAEFNAGESSLDTKSLKSLAVRKAKEFWFAKSDENEMCGTIIYKIKGRS